MRSPTRQPRPTEAQNAISPSPQKAAPERSRTKGDVPPTLLDRYLIERDRKGRPDSFYRDHRAVDPMFRDEGRKLVTRQAYPDAVADMMKIAQHRGWSQVRVSGDEAFRREAWIQGRTLGLEVKGYSPRDRDRQATREPLPAERQSDYGLAARQRGTTEQRLTDAAQVVRRLIPDPAVQARLIERAYTRARLAMRRQSPSPEQDRPAQTSRMRKDR